MSEVTIPETIQNGKYENLSNEAYHGHTESISRSAIMDYAVSPRKYWANYINPARPPKTSTPAMEFGEQFHKMILEPELFIKEYCVEPELMPLPKVGLLRDLGREEFDRQKAERASIEAMNAQITENWTVLNSGKKVIKKQDFEQLMGMKDSLMANEEAWHLITEGKYEQSYFWNDNESGLMCKSRPDILHGSMVVDLKTCRDASARGFQSAMVSGGYHLQAAMIIDAVKAVDKREIITFINIAIEKEYPYSIGIYIIDDAAIAAGREKYKRILKEMKQSKEQNKWVDYETQVIGLPAWVTGE